MTKPTASLFNVSDEVRTCDFQRPHVVILGAGASLAAFPNGDRNDRRLPLMKNFVKVIGLESLLKEHGVEGPFNDFEALYSDISTDSRTAELAPKIRSAVLSYFARLELPDTPTVYDHLVLSLRDKDIIATFNWDPFLFRAAERNAAFAKPPHLAFLHGSVAISYCEYCKITRTRGEKCPVCGVN